MTDGLPAQATHPPKTPRAARGRRSAAPQVGERRLSSSCRIPWIFKLLGAFAVIGLQILFSLDIGIHSSQPIPLMIGAQPRSATAAGVSAETMRPGSAAAEARIPAAAAPGILRRQEPGIRNVKAPPARASHPWIGDSGALLSGLILLGASDPALRSRMTAAR